MVFFIRFIFLAVVIFFILRLLKRGRIYQAPLKKKRPKQRNPRETLGIDDNASVAEIKEAYKKTLSEYHPDKVAHLGKDIQILAEQRTQEIIEAYHRLVP